MEHTDLAHLAKAQDTLLDAVDAPADGLVLEGSHSFPCCSFRLLNALRVIGLPQAVHYLPFERLQAARTVHKLLVWCPEHGVTGILGTVCGSGEHPIKRRPLVPL